MSPQSTFHNLRSISIRLIYGTLPNDSSLFLGTSFASLPGSQVIDLLHIQNHLQLRLVPLRLPGRRHAQKICSTFGSTAKFSLFLLFHGYLFLPRDLQTHHSHPWNRAHPQPSVELLPEYSSSSWNPNSWSLKSALSSARRPPPGDYYVLPGLFMCSTASLPQAEQGSWSSSESKLPFSHAASQGRPQRPRVGQEAPTRHRMDGCLLGASMHCQLISSLI